MFLKNKRLFALFAVASFSQVACYNTYFIDKPELKKLESEVEQREVVVVYGDCDSSASASADKSADGQKTAYKSLKLDGSRWAAAQGAKTDTASDATGTGDDMPPARKGCTRVPVSTANPVKVVTKDGDTYRVTPFNFMMSDRQIVSPEYNLLLSLDDVKGGEVRQFSTWKTVGTILGVSAVAIGTFVGISVLAPKGKGFSSQ